MNVYVDGSGKGDYVFYIEELDVVEVFHEDNITNNEAEYKAILKSLQYLYELLVTGKLKDTNITIYSDSQLVINQLNHIYHIRSNRLRELALSVWRMCREFSVRFIWIPRKENKAGKVLG